MPNDSITRCPVCLACVPLAPGQTVCEWCAKKEVSKVLPMIVGHVSTHWDDGQPTIGEQFQRMIEDNQKLGYALHSWHMTCAMGEDELCETIVAVFAKAE